ncbi:TPA: hypothetical protein JLI26_004804 [Escherichia coli]|nr:hypothetical protein [Escherichia coli]EGA8973809.1 hypothetical protein [Escherichia coli]EJR8278453.1 hypothetical protein [Escherichia coli]MEB6774045.1 hypothetical protein [Escherichia coli]HAW0073167.1 hypothetical protein [Escherichia coli]
MSDSVIVFSRQWAVTAAVAALTERVCSGPVLPVFTQQALETVLAAHPDNGVILGLNPHEHVRALHDLAPHLRGRRVLFVARMFYWTDRILPRFWGLEDCSFCTLDDFHSPGLRRTTLRRIIPVIRNGKARREALRVLLPSGPVKSLEQINLWLEQQKRDVGLIGRERELLLMLAEGNRSEEMEAQRISYFKKRGLEKLQMPLHVSSLYRGIMLRPELQVSLPQAEQDTLRGEGRTA